MTNADKFTNRPPLDYKHWDNGGKFQGVGIPGQSGQKKGTFTDGPHNPGQVTGSKPPRKY